MTRPQVVVSYPVKDKTYPPYDRKTAKPNDLVELGDRVLRVGSYVGNLVEPISPEELAKADATGNKEPRWNMDYGTIRSDTAWGYQP